jgi:hypothetical protein
MHFTPMTTVHQSTTFIPGPGGGDTELSIDRQNRVYYADLAALASYKVTRWNDPARNMATPGAVGNGQQNANGFDRQWFGLWDPTPAQAAAAGYTGPLPVNYLLFAEALLGSSCSSGSCESAAYSTNGTNYSSTTASYNQTGDGPAVVDPKTGAVFEAIGYDNNHVGISILRRNPNHPNNPALKRVQRVKAAAMPTGTSYNTIFPVISIDKNRTIYLAWATQSSKTTAADHQAWQVYYTYATAASGWTNFHKPVRISSPGRAPVTSNTMPWLAAGTGGRVAAVWYGTNDIHHNPSTQDNHQAWNVYLSMLTNADSATPNIRQTKVTNHPMHYGTICLAGLGCIAQAGNRNLADFFEVVPDPKTGAVSIIYDDTGAYQTQTVVPSGSGVPNSAVDHSGAPLVTIAKQRSGIGLFGTSVSGPGRFGSKQIDPAGDALFDPVYGTSDVNQLDLKAVNFHATQKSLVFRIAVRTLHHRAKAIQRLGATTLQYVVRWSGSRIKDQRGLRNPVWYASAETGATGPPKFSAGETQSVDLCSVSGCTPHAFEYPKPPAGGQTVSGKRVKTLGHKPDYFVIRVPKSAVGDPKKGSILQSLSAYSFGRPRTASARITNSEAQGDVFPVEVDGICCRDVKMRR